MLLFFAFLVVGAMMIFVWLDVGYGMFGILQSTRTEQADQNFEALLREVNLLLAQRAGFATSQMALSLQRKTALVGFNEQDSYIRTTTNKYIFRPNSCYTSCLCVYYDTSNWGIREKASIKVRCKDFGKGVYFYTRNDPSDANIGTNIRGVNVFGGTYEHLVFDGRRFGTRAMYLEKLKEGDNTYIYIAEYDAEEIARRKESATT